ncbi:hypothetical protein [Chondromyces apiculatus]|nr:hypothetical protein [Chondromyces apiculatus]
MVAFQTDMSVPKDVDRIRIVATLEGAVVFDESYGKDANEEIKLPATLGFLTPEDPSQALSLRIIASRGSEEDVQVLREVVTTIPEDRTATLQVPIQFLCYGMAEVEREADGTAKRDGDGKVIVKSSCGEGKTCVAGSCITQEIPADDLPDYQPQAIFGGGTGVGDGLCFDTVQCFSNASSAQVDLTSFTADPTVCRVAVPPGQTNVNVALLTQGGGICGSTACYVPLDAESEGGFRAVEEGWLQMPTAVCAQAEAAKLLGVAVTAAGDGTCQQKKSGLPTCGAWSSSGQGYYTAPDGAQPLPIALGLRNPVELEVTPLRVLWTEAGSFDADGAALGDGAVKWVPLEGGQPTVIRDGLVSPRDVVAEDSVSEAGETLGTVFFTTAGTTADDGAIWAAAHGIEPRELLDGRRQPEGITQLDSALLWTELWGDEVLEVALTGAGPTLGAPGEPQPRTSPSFGRAPYRVAAAANVACWTYQGTLQSGDGAVACQRAGVSAELVATQQSTPRALALDVDASGNAQAVYWTSFEGGTVSRFDLSGGSADALVEIAAGQALPGGIAVDERYVYWTNRGDGTVMRADKGGGAPEVVASGQVKPGALAVNASALYWLNEGKAKEEDDTNLAGTGVLMRLQKASEAPSTN